MNIRRPVIILAIIIAAMLILFEGLTTSPDEQWSEVNLRESRTVVGSTVVRSPDEASSAPVERETEKMRSAAQAQWDLAEWHFGRGEYDAAKKEYERLIREFPYTSLDYGFRIDDANKRLRQIREIQRTGDAASAGNPNLPLSGD